MPRRPNKAFQSRRREHGDRWEALRQLLEEFVDAGFLEAKNGQPMYRKPPDMSEEEWLEAIDRWRGRGRGRDA
jgi:hypothetical protein